VNEKQVAIIDSGGANIASLQYALQRLDAVSVVSADAQQIRAASHIILPGVGSAVHAMSRLRSAGLDTMIPDLRQPVLGICLGMQLLFDSSEEGGAQCLRVISGRAMRFSPVPERPVPHMGWNTLDIERENPLLEGLASGDYAYFVHSYALSLSAATVASCSYGDKFSACVQWKNFYGAQFHPERSAKVGERMLRNFLDL
jgi:imidazole glycerol-phosphate synthase subunit HisH